MSFLTEHKEDCSPVKPCSNCQAFSLLRAMLPIDKLHQFITLLGESSDDLMLEFIALETRLDMIPEFEKMSVRTKNCLSYAKIETVADLVRYTDTSIMRIDNFGRKSLEDVRNLLNLIGHRLGELPWEPRVVA